MSTFNARSNSLNAIRLVLASLVIISHAFALGGFGPEPALGGINLGTWGVVGFFGLSGFLITRSRLSPTPARAYYAARFLRIFPGFLAALLMCAFGFAPLSALFDARSTFGISDQAGFVVRNLLLYQPVFGQTGIGSTLASNPFPLMWNGALWTLFWEASCYVSVGVLVSVVGRKLAPAAVLTVFALLTGVGLVNHVGLVGLGDLWPRVLVLLIAFFAGAVVHVFADSISASWRAMLLLFVALAAAIISGFAGVLGPFFLTVLLIRAGSLLPLVNVGRRNDISYGLYIYGWPVQQLIALVVGGAVGPVGFIALSLVIAAGFGWLSWILVEKQAMRLRPVRKSLSAPMPSEQLMPLAK